MRLCLASDEAKLNAKRLTRRLRERYKLRRTPQGYARWLLQKRGWSSQWPCLLALWYRESKWSATAHNASGAHGIPQALPGSKMGPGWESDFTVQVRWGLGYIAGRYGTPCAANGFQAAHNYY